MSKAGSNKQLFLATVAFLVAFADWGIISGLSPLIKRELSLSQTQVSIMIAIPVLLGSVGRIPMGLLTDRLGGRLMFSALLFFGFLPPLALALNHSYPSLLFWGLWLGLAGSSFAVGVGFVSLWFSQERQGTALGIYGMGNIGQSIAVFGGPVLAGLLGIPLTFVLFGVASLIWGGVYVVGARNSPRKATPHTLRQSLELLRTERLSWALSLFYFLTFGGFVAMGIYLPSLLQVLFQLTPQDAGARTAGFVVLATLARPLGGWLCDRIDGRRVLLAVFVGAAALAWLLPLPSIYSFTAGALGLAFLLGIGNGAVFKLVPGYFPTRVGTVTGLVGAAGGLGGFFPPIIMGILKDSTGSFSLGFALLSAFAVGCAIVLWLALLRRPRQSPVVSSPTATR